MWNLLEKNSPLLELLFSQMEYKLIAFLFLICRVSEDQELEEIYQDLLMMSKSLMSNILK